MKKYRILVACEESQAITIEFRKLGFEAFSCDLQECSGGHPEWHIKDDCLKIIKDKWDLVIAHPPCTFLANSSNRWLYNEDKTINEERWRNMKKGAEFFKAFFYSNSPRIAIENPVIHKHAKKIIRTDHSQIINPWQFGHGEQKKTCLWLHNLPLLIPTNIVKGREQRIWKIPPGKDRTKIRSKTYKGIAEAIASQWGNAIINNCKYETSFFQKQIELF